MPSAASALFALPSSNASVSSRLADRRGGLSAGSQANFNEALGRAYDAGEAEAAREHAPADRPHNESAAKADRAKKPAARKTESRSKPRREDAGATDEAPAADPPSEGAASSLDDAEESPVADGESPTGDVLDKPQASKKSEEGAPADDDTLRQLLSFGSANPAPPETAAGQTDDTAPQAGDTALPELLGIAIDEAGGPIEIDPALAAAASETAGDSALAAGRPVARTAGTAGAGVFADESADAAESADLDAPDPDADASTLLSGDSELPGEIEAFAELFESADADSSADGDRESALDDQLPDPTSLVSTPRPQAERTEGPKAPAPPEPPPEARFAEANHEKIVSGVRGELLPNGGTIKLKLDPPELGSMQVSLHLRDGVMTASFQTSNDEATRLLSHTLSDLRASLEAQGIVVDRLHVQQAPREEGSQNSGNNNERPGQQGPEQRQDSRRDQQRKEMVQRLWDKLAGKGPLDLTA